ncbi:MAG TPA: hypothetical protein VKB57_11340 [Acidimicrobiales bacterium]|nr:hypothetical protein [Acidimicrobiales bacterium]
MTAGPLAVSRVNPRYGRDCPAEPEALDYDAYLGFLEEHGHNFIRLWRWEQVRSQAAGGDFHLCMSPQPWARTGPGEAGDGRPRFDLTRFDDAFFDRLRPAQRAVGGRQRVVRKVVDTLHDGVGIGSIVDVGLMERPHLWPSTLSGATRSGAATTRTRSG